MNVVPRAVQTEVLPRDSLVDPVSHGSHIGLTESDLTTTPGAMNDADVDALRSAGFSDRDILDIVEVVGYYAYANRIADGLGIEAEPWIPG